MPVIGTSVCGVLIHSDFSLSFPDLDFLILMGRFSDSNISIFSIQGFDIWFLGANYHYKFALGLFSVSMLCKNLKYLENLNPHT